MNIFDYCELFEDQGQVKLLKFSGTAHLIEDVDEEGEVDLDSGFYWVQGEDGESEEDLMSYVSTFDDGVYLVHTYSWMITDWCEEEGLMWNTYDSGGTDCVRVEVRNGKVSLCD